MSASAKTSCCLPLATIRISSFRPSSCVLCSMLTSTVPLLWLQGGQRTVHHASLISSQVKTGTVRRTSERPRLGTVRHRVACQRRGLECRALPPPVGPFLDQRDAVSRPSPQRHPLSSTAEGCKKHSSTGNGWQDTLHKREPSRSCGHGVVSLLGRANAMSARASVCSLACVRAAARS